MVNPIGVIGSEIVDFASNFADGVVDCAGNDTGRANFSSSQDVSDVSFRFGGDC